MTIQKPSQASPVERVQKSYTQLCLAAADLNTATDELSAAISVWDAVLKRLSLGVSAWVELSSGVDGGRWWDRSIGYTKLKDRWGIALRDRDGVEWAEEHDKVETWSFNEAPRWMRIEGVGRLPDLIEALLKQAEDTTRKIRSKITQAYELAEAIEPGEAHLAQASIPETNLAAETANSLDLAVVDGVAAGTTSSAAAVLTIESSDAFNPSTASDGYAGPVDQTKPEVATAVATSPYGRYTRVPKGNRR